MTYVKLPADYWELPPQKDLGKDAKLLHMTALHQCAKVLSDGALSGRDARTLAAREDVDLLVTACELEDAGLWMPVGEGWYIHDYLHNNWSRAQKEAYDLGRRDNGKKGGRPRNAAKESAGTTMMVSDVDSTMPDTKDRTTVVSTMVPGVDSTMPTIAKSSTSTSASSSNSASPGTPTGARPRTASAGARASAAGVAIPQMPDEWYDLTFEEFRHGYGKVPPRGLRQLWPELCPDEATRAQINTGLEYWRKSRAWVENNPNGDKCQRAEDWLRQQKYLIHPPAFQNGTVSYEEHQGRAGGDAAARPTVYALGDNADPYWAENHGLLSEVRQRKRDLAAGIAVPDDGRTGVGGTVPALPGRRVAQA